MSSIGRELSAEELQTLEVRRLEAEAARAAATDPEVVAALRAWEEAKDDVIRYQTAPFVSTFPCGHEWRDERPRPATCPECVKLAAEAQQHHEPRIRFIPSPTELLEQEHPAAVEQAARYYERREAEGVVVAGSYEESNALARIEANRRELRDQLHPRERNDGRAIRTNAPGSVGGLMSPPRRLRGRPSFYDVYSRI